MRILFVCLKGTGATDRIVRKDSREGKAEYSRKRYTQQQLVQNPDRALGNSTKYMLHDYSTLMWDDLLGPDTQLLAAIG